jgi:hypothetical protein
LKIEFVVNKSIECWNEWLNLILNSKYYDKKSFFKSNKLHFLILNLIIKPKLLYWFYHGRELKNHQYPKVIIERLRDE